MCNFRRIISPVKHISVVACGENVSLWWDLVKDGMSGRMQTTGWWKETQKYNVDKNVVILSFRCLGLRNSTVLVTLPAEKCFTVGHFRNINLIQHSLKQYFIPTIRMICPRSYLATVQKMMSICQNVVLLQKWKLDV